MHTRACFVLADEFIDRRPRRELKMFGGDVFWMQSLALYRMPDFRRVEAWLLDGLDEVGRPQQAVSREVSHQRHFAANPVDKMHADRSARELVRARYGCEL